MKRFAIILCLVSASSALAVELGPKKIECSFTEPFYEIILDLDKAELLKTEYDLEKEEIITKVIAKDLSVSVMPYQKTYRVTAKSKVGKALLTATLNYNGSDGMSDTTSPFHGEYYDSERGEILYGACASETGGNYNYLEEQNQYYEFVTNVGKAIGLCYNRALSDWTDAPSDYRADQSVFYTLYAREIPVGEPGEVSHTFSSAEGEQLSKFVEKTKIPPEDGASLYILRQAKWDYCDYYSSRLHARIEGLTKEP